jgi:hypothetical protein
MDEPVVNVNIINMLLPYSIKMFVMNNVYDHSNIHNMPIGIRNCEKVVPNHKGFSHDILFQEGQQLVNKEHLCLLCFSFTHEDRKTCYNIMKTKDFVLNINDGEYEKQESIHCSKVPVHINYVYLHKSIYVLSPRGAGEATHRFFEAIYLDTIPIVKRTNTVYDKMYTVFPCLVVNNWNDVTEELLQKEKESCLNKMAQFKTNFPNAFTDIDSIQELLLQT